MFGSCRGTTITPPLVVQGLEGKKGCGWRCGQLDRELELSSLGMDIMMI